ncbi:hypothetical protein QC761_0074880 [Podospora bellae-mahoneyi]|uniref:DUF7136 domain-containing protein n=1 Tax=Podospora bellae-mahoneyi TaxID=2093777 RepID=A0ABR0FDN4_9PEZI|nr:hypothetical protein QC761_0074880 [Podospora bellae-mahoneyi]
MHLFVWALWSLLGVLGAVAQAANVMEVNLVFPRNETYTTDQQMPVIFAIRNAHLGPLLKPTVRYLIYNNSDLGQSMPQHEHQFLNASWTDHEPYFVYTFLNMTVEGSYRVLWITSWAHCNGTGDRMRFISDDKTELLDFTIQKDTPATDLVALTLPGRGQACNASPGVTISITNDTLAAPFPHNGNCAVMDPVTPVDASSDPCQLSIDEATAERIQTTIQERLCSGLISERPADCPVNENAAQPGAAQGMWCLAAVGGTMGLLLA